MLRNLLVLVGEVDQEIANLVAILKKTFNVKWIDNGHEAYRFITNNNKLICAVIIDMDIETQNGGLKLLNKINEHEEAKELPSVLLVSNPDTECIMEGVKAGSKDFFAKPFEPMFIKKRMTEIVVEKWRGQKCDLPKKGETTLSNASEHTNKNVQTSNQTSNQGINQKNNKNLAHDNNPTPREENKIIKEELHKKVKKIEEDPLKYSIFAYLPNPISKDQLEILTVEWSNWMDRAFAHKPSYKRYHHIRIKELTKIFAKSYFELHKGDDLTDEKLLYITYGSQFYDIGMMIVPDEIIPYGERQTSLENEEKFYSHIKAREIFFNEASLKHPFIKTVAEIIECHHKNFEGKSYPIYLDSESIPLSAQLVRLATRTDKYICKYIEDFDCAEKAIRGMRTEVGMTISHDMYEAANNAVSELKKVISENYSFMNVVTDEFIW